MLKVSIVPDTNVLISHLELIKQLYTSRTPILCTINFSRTVLDELDNKKGRMVEARNAIRFIESMSKSLKTEIEGHVDERKMDVDVEKRDPIDPKNNDDRILNYCFQLENPILITDDKVFGLKCRSFNIKTVDTSCTGVDELVFKILSELGITPVVAADEHIERLKKGVASTIKPTIISIMGKELGKMIDILQEDESLESYLKIVKTNFRSFKKYISSQAPKVIDEFLSASESKDLDAIKKLVHPLCMIFRQAFDDDKSW